MAIEVGVNSYITVAELEEYALDRGVTITATVKEPLLIKAMDYLETRTFIGIKTTSTQALQFPRILDNYVDYPSDTVPNEIKKAQCIAALLIDAGNDLQEISEQAIKKEKVDVLEVEYQDNSTAYSSSKWTPVYDILKPFMRTGVFGTRI